MKTVWASNDCMSSVNVKSYSKIFRFAQTYHKRRRREEEIKRRVRQSSVRANIDRTSYAFTLLNMYWNRRVFSNLHQKKSAKNKNSCTCIVNTQLDDNAKICWQRNIWMGLLMKSFFCLFCLMYQLVTYHQSRQSNQKKSWKKRRYTIKNYYNDAHIPHEFQFYFTPFSILCGSSKSKREKKISDDRWNVKCERNFVFTWISF